MATPEKAPAPVPALSAADEKRREDLTVKKASVAGLTVAEQTELDKLNAASGGPYVPGRPLTTQEKADLQAGRMTVAEAALIENGSGFFVEQPTVQERAKTTDFNKALHMGHREYDDAPEPGEPVNAKKAAADKKAADDKAAAEKAKKNAA